MLAAWCLMLAAWCLMLACCLLLDAWTPARPIHKGFHKGGAAEGRPPPLWRRPKAASLCGWVWQVFKHQASSSKQAAWPLPNLSQILALNSPPRLIVTSYEPKQTNPHWTLHLLFCWATLQKSSLGSRGVWGFISNCFWCLVNSKRSGHIFG